MTKKKVAIIGAGSWATCISRIVGENVKKHSDSFDSTIQMWVYEETLDDGRKLSEVINKDHTNPKYLPGITIPDNVIGNPNIGECTESADILLFVVPQQFMNGILPQMVKYVKKDALGVTLIKGLHIHRDCTIQLYSDKCEEELGIRMSCLMGANVSLEIAHGQFAETTVGVDSVEDGQLLKQLFHADNFSVGVVVGDRKTVELLGALANLVSCAAGFVDGLAMGHNSKAAVFRLATSEMIDFAKQNYPSSRLETFTQSCGIASLVASSYGGRNRKVCEAFIKTTKTIEELEKELLAGQKAAGPHSAYQVYRVISNRNELHKYPILSSIHLVLERKMKAEEMIDLLRENIRERTAEDILRDRLFQDHHDAKDDEISSCSSCSRMKDTKTAREKNK